MKHTFTLRRNYEFARVYQKGHHVAGRLVVLHYLRRKRADNRLGVTASRQVNGSVPRNRIKRLLRESYRLNESSIRPGFDLILVGRASADHPKLAQVEQEMVRLCRRAGLWLEPPKTASQQVSGGAQAQADLPELQPGSSGPQAVQSGSPQADPNLERS